MSFGRQVEELGVIVTFFLKSDPFYEFRTSGGGVVVISDTSISKNNLPKSIPVGFFWNRGQSVENR